MSVSSGAVTRRVSRALRNSFYGDTEDPAW